jgi:hypothetical protein
VPLTANQGRTGLSPCIATGITDPNEPPKVQLHALDFRIFAELSFSSFLNSSGADSFLLAHSMDVQVEFAPRPGS